MISLRASDSINNNLIIWILSMTTTNRMQSGYRGNALWTQTAQWLNTLPHKHTLIAFANRTDHYNVPYNTILLVYLPNSTIVYTMCIVSLMIFVAPITSYRVFYLCFQTLTDLLVFFDLFQNSICMHHLDWQNGNDRCHTPKKSTSILIIDKNICMAQYTGRISCDSLIVLRSITNQKFIENMF